MGKATVVSHLGGALYRVTINYNEAESIQLENRLQQELNKQNIFVIPELQTARNDAQSTHDLAFDSLNIATTAYALDPSAENKETVEEKQSEWIKSLRALQLADIQLNAAKSRALSLEKQIQWVVDHRLEDKQIDAWCVDMMDNLTKAEYSAGAIIGTIEISGQEGLGVVLQPGWDDLEAFTPARDGQLHGITSLTPEGWYYNKALTPGWQRWRHPYRSGIIVDGNEIDGWDVRLDDLISLEPNRIHINDQTLLPLVQADYLDCDNAAFTVGDHVVVLLEWTDWGTPSEVQTETIIGFVAGPKPCRGGQFIYFPIGSITTGPPQKIDRPAFPGGWVMTTPITTDYQATTTGGWPRGWYGVPDPIQCEYYQLVWDDDSLWMTGAGFNAAKVAVKLPNWSGVPEITLGNPHFGGAAVSPDGLYIYAIFNNTAAEHEVVVARKTTNIELTGAIYHPTTDPDGWEILVVDLADQVNSIGSGNLTAWKVQWSFNRFCTEARAMFDYVHGARRTPQLDPGLGSQWEGPPDGSDYEETWKQEERVTIALPSAADIASAGIAVQSMGIQGQLYSQYDFSSNASASGPHSMWCGPGFTTYWLDERRGNRTYQSTHWGTYKHAVGWDGDKWVYAEDRLQGGGVHIRDGVMTENQTGSPGACENTTVTKSHTISTVVNEQKITNIDGIDYILYSRVKSASGSGSTSGGPGDPLEAPCVSETKDEVIIVGGLKHYGNRPMDLDKGVLFYQQRRSDISTVTVNSPDPDPIEEEDINFCTCDITNTGNVEEPNGSMWVRGMKVYQTPITNTPISETIIGAPNTSCADYTGEPYVGSFNAKAILEGTQEPTLEGGETIITNVTGLKAGASNAYNWHGHNNIGGFDYFDNIFIYEETYTDSADQWNPVQYYAKSWRGEIAISADVAFGVDEFISYLTDGDLYALCGFADPEETVRYFNIAAI